MKNKVVLFLVIILLSVRLFAVGDDASAIFSVTKGIKLNGTIEKGTIINPPVSDEEIIISVNGLNIVARIETKTDKNATDLVSAYSAPDITSSWDSLTDKIIRDEDKSYSGIDLLHNSDNGIDSLTINYGIWGNVPDGEKGVASVSITAEWTGGTTKDSLYIRPERKIANKTENALYYASADDSSDTTIIFHGENIQESVIVAAAHAITWGNEKNNTIQADDWDRYPHPTDRRQSH